jgi:16S rRNA processing protein RimM
VSARVCIGAIIGAHGVRGQVRVKSFTADPRDVGAYGPVEDEAGTRRFRLRVSGAPKDGVVVAQIEGVVGRDAAEALKGTALYVPKAALPPPEEDEFYHADLIGLRVELKDGSALGRVKALFDFGAGDVLEVETEGKGTLFLPFTRAVVPVVDVAGGRLVAVPPGEIEARPEGDGEDGEGDDGE